MALSKIENINLLYSEDICLDTKTLFITGEVDEEMYKKVLKGIHILNQSTAEITMYLNTGGGDVTAGKAIYDIIKHSSNLVRIIAMGEVASAGTMILMAGDTRIMMPNAHLMLHSGAESLPSMKPRDVDATLTQFRKDEDLLYSTYADRLNEKKIKDKKKKLTIDDIKSMLINDWYLNAEEALKLGLIDQIGHKL